MIDSDRDYPFRFGPSFLAGLVAFVAVNVLVYFFTLSTSTRGRPEVLSEPTITAGSQPLVDDGSEQPGPAEAGPYVRRNRAG